MSGLSFGFGSSKNKNVSYIAPEDKSRQLDNYGQAQGLLGNYTATSPGQIAAYYNPYEQQVVDQSQQDFEHQRQMAVNTIGDQATAAHAFGGSRHGVAEGITNGEYGRTSGLLTAGLRAQGYGQALQTAQDENRYGYAYPLARQGLLNQTLAGVTPQTYNKGKQSGFQVGWSGGGGGSSGGGGGGGGGDISSYMDMLALAGG